MEPSNLVVIEPPIHSVKEFWGMLTKVAWSEDVDEN